jgi:hypothetical protein
MGGLGSGCDNHWWRPDKKTTVEDCLSLDSNVLMRDGVLKAGLSTPGAIEWTYPSGNSFRVNFAVDTRDLGNSFLRLSYTWVWTPTRDEESVAYRLAVTTTRPQFGGQRWWFLCPLAKNDVPCLRRVGKLYLPPNTAYFGCRQCHDLTYISCQESHQHDKMYRFLASRLGADVATIKRALKIPGQPRT